jgi:hypothetical protein
MDDMDRMDGMDDMDGMDGMDGMDLHGPSFACRLRCGRAAIAGGLRRGEGWAGVDGFGVGSLGGADGVGLGRDLASSDGVEVFLDEFGGFGG